MTRRKTLLCLALFVAVAAGVVIQRTWSHQRRVALCAEVGSRLQHRIGGDPRFSDVAVLVTTHPRVVVSAPDDLPSSTRAELEQIVATDGRPLDVHIQYAPSTSAYASPASR